MVEVSAAMVEVSAAMVEVSAAMVEVSVAMVVVLVILLLITGTAILPLTTGMVILLDVNIALKPQHRHLMVMIAPMIPALDESTLEERTMEVGSWSRGII